MAGFYLTVEGLDGAGTTSVARELAGRLADAELTTEPKDELWTGEAVRTALADDTSPTTDAFLFMADRAEHLHRVVEPALEEGSLVVSDRGADSTYAYQPRRLEGVVADPWEWLDELYAPWNRQPDLTLYLDVSVDTAMGRMDGGEKYEVRRVQERAREGYERLADRHERRFARVDAERPLDEVVDDCLSVVRATESLGGVEAAVTDGGET